MNRRMKLKSTHHRDIAVAAMGTHCAVVERCAARGTLLFENFATERAELPTHRVTFMTMWQKERFPIHLITMVGRTMRIGTKAVNKRRGHNWTKGRGCHILLQLFGRLEFNLKLFTKFMNHLVIQLRAITLFKH